MALTKTDHKNNDAVSEKDFLGMTMKGYCRAMCVVFLLGHDAWADEVFRWQDKMGQWHFGGPEAAVAGAEVLDVHLPSAGLSISSGVSVFVDNAETVGGGLKKSRRPPAVKKQKKERNEVDAGLLRQRQKEKCDRKREQLRKSRLGLRDHEAQDAYAHECILGIYW